MCEYYSILYMFRIEPSTTVQGAYGVCNKSSSTRHDCFSSYIQTTELECTIVEGRPGKPIQEMGIQCGEGEVRATYTIFNPVGSNTQIKCFCECCHVEPEKLSEKCIKAHGKSKTESICAHQFIQFTSPITLFMFIPPLCFDLLWHDLIRICFSFRGFFIQFIYTVVYIFLI